MEIFTFSVTCIPWSKLFEMCWDQKNIWASNGKESNRSRFDYQVDPTKLSNRPMPSLNTNVSMQRFWKCWHWIWWDWLCSRFRFRWLIILYFLIVFSSWNAFFTCLFAFNNFFNYEKKEITSTSIVLSLSKFPCQNMLGIMLKILRCT